MTPDYKKLGLKCGIEIHQQLDTTHKLFCSCPARMSDDEPCCEIRRRLSAVAGETGKVDAAARYESLLGRTFIYRIYDRETCLVETDEEPPHDINREALETALKISLMLGCEIPEEVHTMRKIVIDGSNTSGFQRTLMVGLNGKLETGKCEVGITNVCLEEDSAQIIEKRDDVTVYGLDRLGIPLVEIGTTPDIHTPEDARAVAERIGMILRSTGAVKRGLGTIRQDVNVSIEGGARIEIKGAQELRMIPKLVEKEARRQASILAIRDELRKRGFRHAASKVNDVSRFFESSESRIMKGKEVFAIIVPGFAGMLARKITDTRTLGNEIANYIRVRAGIKGIIHSDENLQKYSLEDEFVHVGRALGAKKGDTVIIMAADRKLAGATADAFKERINQFLKGVPSEVRKALENGDTEFMRPMAGSARMYPETDVPPAHITKEMIAEMEKNLPETWDKKITRLAKKYRISEDMSRQLVQAGHDGLFERLSKSFKPGIVAGVLVSTLREIGREGYETARITDEKLSDLFSLLASGSIAKEAIPDMLRKMAENPEKPVSELASSVKTINGTELAAIIKRIIKSKKELLNHPRREKVLMGLVMKEVRGAVDGKKVMEALIKELKKY